MANSAPSCWGGPASILVPLKRVDHRTVCHASQPLPLGTKFPVLRPCNNEPHFCCVATHQNPTASRWCDCAQLLLSHTFFPFRLTVPKFLFGLFVITGSQTVRLPLQNSLVFHIFSTILSVAAWLLPRIAPVLFVAVFVAAAAAGCVFHLLS